MQGLLLIEAEVEVEEAVVDLEENSGKITLKMIGRGGRYFCYPLKANPWETNKE